MRVEIIGGMGVGKTTLCNAFTRLGIHCVNENLANNPYLNLAYADPASYGFYSQLSFYLGNFFTIRQSTQADRVTVFDFSVVTDRAYASLFLKDEAQRLALETIDFLEEKEGQADLYLYLTCSPETQMARIRARNRDHEKGVTLDFIRDLEGHLANHAVRAAERGARIRTIDTEKFDLLNDADFVAVLGENLRTGDNPLASMAELRGLRAVA
ncbi:deoxynucleoside kinase [Micavibrio aeruginosavorus]|uniref:Deoxyadenosine kinase / Deoxyguanosine kinase n=1 Tax=Micavibrio aeruginosavorus EPB TaxID=349215 RepID=M4VXZ5_9BACT|nr:deoxynucleoside kinase [Micavibrio aeruginosavorus]AGH98044.1 Deoxyadenosine kinase / Deoxyguanosine kinase [Micavibrio aeruginosavorus EPB]